MLQIIFFYVVIEIPGDIVKLIHRTVSGDRYREANKWLYRFGGLMLTFSIAGVFAAVAAAHGTA